MTESRVQIHLVSITMVASLEVPLAMVVQVLGLGVIDDADGKLIPLVLKDLLESSMRMLTPSESRGVLEPAPAN